MVLVLPGPHAGTRGDGAVSNEAIVKLFTSCLVKRDHSVVEMKVFEIFIPVYMVLEWKSSGKQKDPKLPAQKPLGLHMGMVVGRGMGGEGTALGPLNTHLWVHFLLLQAPAGCTDGSFHHSPLLSRFRSVFYLKTKKGKNKFSLL